jgi:hypothetical protein
LSRVKAKAKKGENGKGRRGVGYGEKLLVQNVRRWRVIDAEREFLRSGHDCGGTFPGD